MYFDILFWFYIMMYHAHLQFLYEQSNGALSTYYLSKLNSWFFIIVNGDNGKSQIIKENTMVDRVTAFFLSECEDKSSSVVNCKKLAI